MSTVTAAPIESAAGPKAAFDAVAIRARRAHHRGTFSEVRDAHRHRALQVAAVSSGIVSVTVLASAAVVLGLSA
ncbi:hypothetical protein ACLBWP_06640 [Microbacterium sp. M1A1_1b]|uniref:hypothetical protein n=1 Tax=Curtobacterium sp. VKM Ac-2922 TaxID=2929475 RepID=UPI001FB1A76B|nr:hypothetical protein [Curtobacterium sp. VKM Ac-2922]MCJ1714745.1 hypothetical protein [Curtobacterium sp. VKM Ac-2922]